MGIKEKMDNIAYIGGKFLAVFIIAKCLVGCSWTGTKSVDMWGLKWENYAGMDARVGFNNVDKVEDQRGVDAREPAKVTYTKGGKY